MSPEEAVCVVSAAHDTSYYKVSHGQTTLVLHVGSAAVQTSSFNIPLIHFDLKNWLRNINAKRKK